MQQLQQLEIDADSSYLFGVKFAQFFQSLFTFLVQQGRVVAVYFVDGGSSGVVLVLELAEHLRQFVGIVAARVLARVNLVGKVQQLFAAASFGVLQMLGPVFGAGMTRFQT